MAILVAIPLGQVRDMFVQGITICDAWYSARKRRKLAAAVLYGSVVTMILVSLTLGTLNNHAFHLIFMSII